MQTDEKGQPDRPEEEINFLTVSETAKRVGASKRTIYNWIESGKFPKPVRLSAGKNGFVATEITAWQQARMAEREA